METLLIIDIQNDYFEGGLNPLVGSNRASLSARQLLQFFRNRKLPIIHIKDLSFHTLSKEARGAEFHPNVLPIDGEQVFAKSYPNAFRETFLEDYLDQIKATKLVICGMMTHLSVESTSRFAKDLGYDITVIGDACASCDLIWENDLIPAEVVQSVHLASLHRNFARVMDTRQFFMESEEKHILIYAEN